VPCVLNGEKNEERSAPAGASFTPIGVEHSAKLCSRIRAALTSWARMANFFGQCKLPHICGVEKCASYGAKLNVTQRG
jgi:hypothetical protein